MNLKQEKNNFNSQLTKTVSAQKILDKCLPFEEISNLYAATPCEKKKISCFNLP